MISLREIAEETINIENLQESLIAAQQKHVQFDLPEEEEIIELLESETHLAGVTPDAPLADGEDAPEDGMPQMRFEDAVDES